MIESKDQDNVWGTVGVSENVIEASWLALVDAFEYKLAKDRRRSRQSHGAVATIEPGTSLLHAVDLTTECPRGSIS